MTSEELLNKIQSLKDTVATYEDTIKNLTLVLAGQLTAEGKDGIKTDAATGFWQKQTKVEVKDWNAVMDYVYANKAFDILQKRISPAQLKSRIDAGAKITGVTITEGAKTFIVKGKKDED